jgi:hypothetical protein
MDHLEGVPASYFLDDFVFFPVRVLVTFLKKFDVAELIFWNTD